MLCMYKGGNFVLNKADCVAQFEVTVVMNRCLGMNS